MSKSYLVSMDDIVSGKVQPDTIEHRYVLVGTRDLVKLVEGINYLAKFGWRPIGFSRENRSCSCLMERVG